MTETLASVVEQFLTARGPSGASTTARSPSCGCSCASPTNAESTGSISSRRHCSMSSLPQGPGRVLRSFNHLLGVVDCLLDWAVAQELLSASPLRTRRRRVTSVRVPFLFDAAQARRLLDAAAALPDNARAVQRGPTYRTIFALCYGLGLRAGEACGLHLGDVELERNLLVVVGGKFGKSRLVPHGPGIAELVGEQVVRRRTNGASDTAAPLFSFDGRRCVHPGTASQVFHHLVTSLELPPSQKGSHRRGCTISGTLSPSRACCGGIGKGSTRPAGFISCPTFMGHVDPASTAVYLTITPALLEGQPAHFGPFALPALGGGVR